MPDPEIKNPVMRHLVDQLAADNRTREFYESHVRSKAERIEGIRRQFKSDMAEATEDLRKAEKGLEDSIADVNRWEAAIRALRMMRLAGDEDAIAAIGEEDKDAK